MFTTTTSDGSVIIIGSAMVEVNSVQIHRIDGENPVDLYGTIQVTDGWGNFYIYNRARDNRESIILDETVTLVGPYRAAPQAFEIFLDLKDKNADLSSDNEFSKGFVAWTINSLDTTVNKYNKPMSSVVNGEYGKATVYYSILKYALEATIQIIFVEGDEGNPVGIYGSIVARFKDDFYSNIDSEEKKYYQSVLFNKNSTNYINVQLGDCISLSRYVVAVPTNSSLIVEANLWNHDGDNIDDEIAKGSAEFYPLPNMPTEKDIGGTYGKVIVRVSWSTLSGGNL